MNILAKLVQAERNGVYSDCRGAAEFRSVSCKDSIFFIKKNHDPCPEP